MNTVIFIFSLLITLPLSASFKDIINRYLDYYFKTYPTSATTAGIHTHDTQLENFSQKAIQNHILTLKKFLVDLKTISSHTLDLETSLDYETLILHLKARLLELETIRMWEKNPDTYNSIVSQSIYLLISRQFASPLERLKSVIAREKKIPELFQSARKNIKNPPRLYTEIALEQVSGTIDFFKKDVPNAFTKVRDSRLFKEFQKTNQKTIQELENYHTFLKQEVLPNSKGDFRLGEDLYRKKLLYEEMIDIPLDQLLKIGFENLRENQKWFQETAKKIDSQKSSKTILTRMMKDHPTSHQLLSTVRQVTQDLKAFVINKKIVTLPSPILPRVEETPTFGRALFFASMEAPGPFEKKATEAYYHITPAESYWPPRKIEEHLQEFNYPVILSTSIHETYPGHYLQFLWLKEIPSQIRKLFGCSSNIEGWAHYTEQMLLDEGYGNENPYLRLGQLQDALLRNARFIAGIQMHTGKMSYEEAIDFFIKEGYQSETNAQREARRGTIDPTYLYYTFGKLALLKLRNDYKKLKGGRLFSLLTFHDEFLKHGPIPFKLIQRSLLGYESPLL